MNSSIPENTEKTQIGKYRFNMKSGQIILASTFEVNFLVHNYLQSPPVLILNNPLIFLSKMALLGIYISNIGGKMSCFSCKETHRYRFFILAAMTPLRAPYNMHNFSSAAQC